MGSNGPPSHSVPPPNHPSPSQQSSASTPQQQAAQPAQQPQRSRNARAQARHRAKRKAYIEQLEDTVTKLQAALNLTPEQVAAMPPAQIRIRELENENYRLKLEVESLRTQIVSLSAGNGGGVVGGAVQGEAINGMLRSPATNAYNAYGQDSHHGHGHGHGHSHHHANHHNHVDDLISKRRRRDSDAELPPGAGPSTAGSSSTGGVTQNPAGVYLASTASTSSYGHGSSSYGTSSTYGSSSLHGLPNHPSLTSTLSGSARNLPVPPAMLMSHGLNAASGHSSYNARHGSYGAVSSGGSNAPTTPSGSSPHSSSTGGTPNAFSVGMALPPVDQLSSMNNSTTAGASTFGSLNSPGNSSTATAVLPPSSFVVNGSNGRGTPSTVGGGTPPSQIPLQSTQNQNQSHNNQTQTQNQRPRVQLPPLGLPSSSTSLGYNNSNSSASGGSQGSFSFSGALTSSTSSFGGTGTGTGVGASSAAAHGPGSGVGVGGTHSFESLVPKTEDNEYDEVIGTYSGNVLRDPNSPTRPAHQSSYNFHSSYSAQPPTSASANNHSPVSVSSSRQSPHAHYTSPFTNNPNNNQNHNTHNTTQSPHPFTLPSPRSTQAIHSHLGGNGSGGGSSSNSRQAGNYGHSATHQSSGTGGTGGGLPQFQYRS